MFDGEWLRLSEAASLLNESTATVRRHAASGRIQSRSAPTGRPGLELLAVDIWAWRAEKLQRLRVDVDPLRPGGSPTVFDSLASELIATQTALEVAQTELARAREALSMVMAADDASEQRARAWKGVARALTAPVTPHAG